MIKLALPVAVAALLVAVPAWAEMETETHVESTHVEESADSGVDERTTKSMEVERESALGTTTKSVESTRTEEVEADGDEVESEVTQHVEKSTEID